MQTYRYSRIHEVSKRIRKQEVSPIDVVGACLKRIEALNPELNAFITVLADRAMEQARIAEAEIRSGDWRGPLLAFRWGSKISTIRPVLRLRPHSSNLRIACQQGTPWA